jgi:hypothetical protein
LGSGTRQNESTSGRSWDRDFGSGVDSLLVAGMLDSVMR